MGSTKYPSGICEHRSEEIGTNWRDLGGEESGKSIEEKQIKNLGVIFAPGGKYIKWPFAPCPIRAEYQQQGLLNNSVKLLPYHPTWEVAGGRYFFKFCQTFIKRVINIRHWSKFWNSTKCTTVFRFLHQHEPQNDLQGYRWQSMKFEFSPKFPF